MNKYFKKSNNRKNVYKIQLLYYNRIRGEKDWQIK